MVSGLFVQTDRVDWKSHGLCKNADTEWFYDVYEQSEPVANAIDSMCLACPFLRICSTHGQENGEWGVWGGIYWNGAGKPDKNRNSHKTEEWWEEFRARILQQV